MAERLGTADVASAAAKRHLAALVRERAARRSSQDVSAEVVASVLADERLMLHPARRGELIVEIMDEVLGAGPLAPLMRMVGVTDVIVNAPDRVYVDVGRGLERTAVTFADDSAVRDCAARLARLAGRRLDDAHPFVDARLPTGERLHALLPPISTAGTLISIRVPRKQALSWRDLCECGSIDPRYAMLISAAVSERQSILITGGTGSGKTTVLNSLLGECDERDRIVVVEDTAEISVNHPHVVQLECRPANTEGVGAVTMADLVRQSLRMRPDRLVVGEVRGGEVVDLLMALNTGHTGSMATLHANRPADVPSRIEVMAASWGFSRRGLHQAVAAAFAVIVHMARTAEGRRVVAEVCRLGMSTDGVELKPC